MPFRPESGLVDGGKFEAILDLQVASYPHKKFVVCVVGLNRFRRINLFLGYRSGDLALQEMSQRVCSFPHAAAPACHLGGDEFALLLECGTRRAASQIAEKLIGWLGRPLVVHGHEFHMTMSVGLAMRAARSREGASLLRRAFSAMMQGKAHGGNSVAWAGALETPSHEQAFRLESALHHAIERQELSLRFQPEVDRNGQVRAVEALLMWKSADLGQVDTETFIRLAEETGVIAPIGEWVLREACRQVARWSSDGRGAPCVAVNVSPQQFAAADFVATVKQILEETGVHGENLELEVTESCILADIEQSAARMAELRRLGIRIAIDDFGVGYSPLAYLHRLPLDKIKVDRSFVRQIAQPGGTLPVVHTITVLAHHRGLQVVAEGVETEEEFDLVHAARCDLVQGYYVGYPLSAEEISSRLSDQRSFARYAVAASNWNY